MFTTRSEVRETSIMSNNSKGNPVLSESDTVSYRIVVWTMSASTTSWWFVVPIGSLFWFLLPYFVSDKLRKWWIYHAPGKWCMPLSTNKVKAMRLGHGSLWNCQLFHVIRIICNISCWPELFKCHLCLLKVSISYHPSMKLCTKTCRELKTQNQNKPM